VVFLAFVALFSAHVRATSNPWIPERHSPIDRDYKRRKSESRERRRDDLDVIRARALEEARAKIDKEVKAQVKAEVATLVAAEVAQYVASADFRRMVDDMKRTERARVLGAIGVEVEVSHPPWT
jgi:hypothetical protein